MTVSHNHLRFTDAEYHPHNGGSGSVMLYCPEGCGNVLRLDDEKRFGRRMVCSECWARLRDEERMRDEVNAILDEMEAALGRAGRVG